MFSTNRNMPDTVVKKSLLLFVISVTCCSISTASAQEFPPTERSEVGTKWKVSGKVRSSIRPLSGVKIHMVRHSSYYVPMGRNAPRKEQSPVTSKFTGEFEVNVLQDHQLLFSTPEFAPLQVPVPEGSSLDVKLETGRTISGIIERTSGEPIAGALVTPVQWIIPPTTESTSNGNKHTTCGFPADGKAWAVKTNSKGKFELNHMPSGYRVGLSVKAEGWKEEIVFVRHESDTRPADNGQILMDNDFTYKTEPCALLEIKAADESGTPAAIARVSIYPISNSTNAFEMRRIETVNDTHATLSIPAHSTGSIVHVEPVDADRLMGFRMKLPANDDVEIIEMKIEFATGKTIRGIVTNETNGNPIEGVNIQWGRLDDPYKNGVKGAFSSLNVKTGRQGKFAIAVPDVHGIVSVAGRVEGYCTSECAAQFRDQYPFAKEVFDQLSHELNPGEMDDLPPIEFKLKSAYSVELTVIDETGKPSPNCVVAWNKRNSTLKHVRTFNSIGVHGGGSPKSFTDSTDANGKVLIPNLYTDAFFIAKAHHDNKTTDKRRFNGFDEYPIKIQAFSIDGFRQGLESVPLPELESESSSIPVTINLVIGGNVIGQIIDENGVGIPDLEIQTRSGGRFWDAGQLWTTKTREDGRFKIQGLPASLRIDVDS